MGAFDQASWTRQPLPGASCPKGQTSIRPGLGPLRGSFVQSGARDQLVVSILKLQVERKDSNATSEITHPTRHWHGSRMGCVTRPRPQASVRGRVPPKRPTDERKSPIRHAA